MDRDTAAHETSEQSQAVQADGYREMAADIEHEMEAEEWVEQILFEVE